MAGNGGRRPGAGRKKGGKNKTTKSKEAKKVIQDLLIKAGTTPLEFMLNIMLSPDMDMASRFEAAKAAAPYVHPRLSNVEHSNAKLDLTKLTDAELRKLDEIVRAATDEGRDGNRAQPARVPNKRDGKPAVH